MLRDSLSGIAVGYPGKSAYCKFNAEPGYSLKKDKGLHPILGVDVWEGAYYLTYKNMRVDYIKAFWHVLDLDAVSQLYQAAVR